MTAADRIHLRLGTRGSLLAKKQSQGVAADLQRLHPALNIELVTLRTTGDAIQDRPLAELGGKGLFVKELEQALLANQIDFAVHSYKDLPVTMPVVDESDLVVAAVPPRADAHDVAVLRDPTQLNWPPQARVGTSSLRRRCQILAAHPDAHVLPLRGNIDTRLRKLRDGEFDMIVLAHAGLKRAGLLDWTAVKEIGLLPAAGQGALALQCRRDDQQTRDLLAGLHDLNSAAFVDAERALVAKLRGDCHSPIAAWATMDWLNVERSRPQSTPLDLRFQAAVGATGGNPPVLRAEARCRHTDIRAGLSQLVDQVFADLAARGAMALLHGSESDGG